MWDSIRKRINILEALQKQSEDLADKIADQEANLQICDFEVRRIRNEIRDKANMLNPELENKNLKSNRPEEYFRLDFKKDFAVLLKGFWIIIKWVYAAIVFLFMGVIFLVLFGFPIYLTVENGWAGWRTIFGFIFSWSLCLIYIVFLVNHFGKQGDG